MPDPALIFSDPADRAGTHVLLIGIGDYPWLEGGAKCTTPARMAAAMGLRQLGAPPLSMREMADWFLDGFANPDKPLASVALLLSEPEPASYRGQAVPRGAIADVKRAVAAWVTRANARRDNALIFAFCGHGMQSGQNSVLLCRDFARNEQSIYDGAIDFEDFRIALSTRMPDTQLLLIDACRTRDLEIPPLGQATPGDPLIGVASTMPRNNTQALQCVQYATSPNTTAWGPDNGASLFTRALLDSLAGGGADRTQQWWVTTTELQAALATYLPRLARQWDVQQVPGNQSLPFRICKPETIVVPLYVSSNEALIWQEKVTIRAARGTDFTEEIAHDPQAAPDRSECEFRLLNPSQKPRDVTYDVFARFPPGSPFLDVDDQVIAYPPEAVCELSVSRR